MATMFWRHSLTTRGNVQYADEVQGELTRSGSCNDVSPGQSPTDWLFPADQQFQV